MSFLKTLSRVVSNIDLPYGYTLSVWSAGALSLYRYGIPTPWQIILFVSGATLGYLSPVVFVYPYVEKITVPLHIRKIALINVFSVVASLVSILVILLVQLRLLGWFLAGFVATLVYILCFSALLYFSK